jgi:hypothetical protein
MHVFLACIFISTVCFAGDYVVYDGNGYITQRYRSVDGNHPVNQLPNHLMISRDEFNSLTRWHKVENGQVVSMSQVEIDTILQAEADARAQAEEQAIQNYQISNLELLTALVQCINTRIPNNPITKNEIIQQIKDNRN